MEVQLAVHINTWQLQIVCRELIVAVGGHMPLHNTPHPNARRAKRTHAPRSCMLGSSAHLVWLTWLELPIMSDPPVPTTHTGQAPPCRVQATLRSRTTRPGGACAQRSAIDSGEPHQNRTPSNPRIRKGHRRKGSNGRRSLLTPLVGMPSSTRTRRRDSLTEPSRTARNMLRASLQYLPTKLCLCVCMSLARWPIDTDN